MNFKSKNETLTQVYLRIMKELTNPKRNVLALSISYKKDPERIICHIYDLVDIEQDRCQQVDFIFSTDSNYYVVREGDYTFSPDDIPSTACSIDIDIDNVDEIVALELVYRAYEINFDYAIYELLEDIPLTANEIDRNSDFYESSVAMTLLCCVVDKLTGPANEALEYMLEISNHSYMSSYMNINDISPINFKRIAEIEDMDVKQFENAITTNTVTIEICKEKTKISVKLNKRMEEYSDCDLSDNLKVRILIGIIRAKYFMEEGGTDEFDCIYYHQSNVMDFPNSIHL